MLLYFVATVVAVVTVAIVTRVTVLKDVIVKPDETIVTIVDCGESIDI